MDIANFFADAARRRPVAPREIHFTLTCRDGVLPGGAPNTGGQTIAAIGTGALVFLGGDETEDLRTAARSTITKKCQEAQPTPIPVMEGDVNIEAVYQLVYRALRKWDPKERRAGDRLFVDLEQCRSLLVFKEANRIADAYWQYVEDEHPSSVDPATFRDAEGAGKGMAAQPPR